MAKTMWFIGVEVEQETSASPPKKILDPPLCCLELFGGMKAVKAVSRSIGLILPVLKIIQLLFCRVLLEML